MKLLAIIIAALIWASSAAASSPTTVYVRHHDPGCHWYLNAQGKRVSSLSLRGPVRLVNQDIGTQILLTPTGSVIMLKIGHAALLTQKGVYVERMVGQGPDDNTDYLVIS